MLKMTGVKLDLISNINFHLFIEKGMTGGISYIYKGYSKVNDCDSEEKKSIIYWDANKLYGWGMNQPLPYSDFNFSTEKEINKFCLDSISENSPTGYLEHSTELHDLNNDYPLCSEKVEISSDMLSKYCSDIADKYGIKVGGVKKLVPNLRDKKKYIVHYRNLQLCLKLGMKLTKVHRVLKFKQSNWLKEYIEFNTKKKMNSKNSFEANFLKLLIMQYMEKPWKISKKEYMSN